MIFSGARRLVVQALGCAPSIILCCNGAETLQIVSSLLTDNADVERSVLASPEILNQLMHRLKLLA